MRDPVITYAGVKTVSVEADNPVYQDITRARVAQHLETPLQDRIESVSWPEAVVYFSTLTMDARYAGREVKELYHYSFRRYLDRWKSSDPEELPAPLDEKPELAEYHRERLDDLRFGLKKDRDRYFVENVYEELGVESVPESFWVSPEEQGGDLEGRDEFGRSALQEYVREG